MPRNVVRRPEASYRLKVNGRELRGEKWAGAGWVFYCDYYPDLADRFGGVEDASEAIAEFTRRALAQSE